MWNYEKKIFWSNNWNFIARKSIFFKLQQFSSRNSPIYSQDIFEIPHRNENMSDGIAHRNELRRRISQSDGNGSNMSAKNGRSHFKRKEENTFKH